KQTGTGSTAFLRLLRTRPSRAGVRFLPRPELMGRRCGYVPVRQNLSWHNAGDGRGGGTDVVRACRVDRDGHDRPDGSAPSALETLADAIRERGLTPSSQELPNLDKRITSYSFFQGTDEFLIAYYVDDRSGALKEPLFVDRYDAATHAWTSVKITHQN